MGKPFTSQKIGNNFPQSRIPHKCHSLFMSLTCQGIVLTMQCRRSRPKNPSMNSNDFPCASPENPHTHIQAISRSRHASGAYVPAPCSTLSFTHGLTVGPQPQGSPRASYINFPCEPTRTLPAQAPRGPGRPVLQRRRRQGFQATSCGRVIRIRSRPS